MTDESDACQYFAVIYALMREGYIMKHIYIPASAVALAAAVLFTACARGGGDAENVPPAGQTESEQVTGSETATVPDKPTAELYCGILDGIDEEKVAHGAEYRYNEDSKSWDEVYSIDNVSVVYDTADNKLAIEYMDSVSEVPWAVQHNESGAGMRIGLVDLTMDRQDELVLEVYDRERSLYFVYDLKNGRDLSPHYCEDASDIASAYFYPEYAKELGVAVNESFANVGMAGIYTDGGGLKVDYLCSRRDNLGEISKSIVKNKMLSLQMYMPVIYGTYWNCDFDVRFDGNGCHISNVEAENGFLKYSKKIQMQGENSLEGTVEYENGHFCLVYTGEDVEVKILIDGKNSPMEVYLDGKKVERDEFLNVDAYELLSFSAEDDDGDGVTDKLVWTTKYPNQKPGSWAMSFENVPLSVNAELIESVPGLIKEALTGRREIIFNGESIQSVEDIVSSATGRKLREDTFSVVDFDADGFNEVVMYDEPSYIFHTDGERVYVYAIPYRGLTDIKTDGTWNSSGGASEYYYKRFAGFTDTEMLGETYLHIHGDTYWDGDYYSEEGQANELTEEQANAVMAEHSDVKTGIYRYSKHYFEGKTFAELFGENRMPDMPTFADITKLEYDNPELGKELAYEYDEQNDRWYAAFKYGDVILRRIDSVSTELEYQGRKYFFDKGWTIELDGTLSGMDIDMRDVTGDGVPELILSTYNGKHIDECSSVSIFDLAEWKDITPYYAVESVMSLWVDDIAEIEQQIIDYGTADDYVKIVPNPDGSMPLDFLGGSVQKTTAELSQDGELTVTYMECGGEGQRSICFRYVYDGEAGAYIYKDMDVTDNAEGAEQQ